MIMFYVRLFTLKKKNNEKKKVSREQNLFGSNEKHMDQLRSVWLDKYWHSHVRKDVLYAINKKVFNLIIEMNKTYFEEASCIVLNQHNESSFICSHYDCDTTLWR